ncbi:MAG: glycosyltransferase family 2 protein [Pseudomonadota bacterium]
MKDAEPSLVDVTLIVPAFNESTIIAGTVEELADYMASDRPDLSYELMIVDDGSTDGMADIIRDLQAKHPQLRLAQHNINRGRGRAVRTGFEQSTGQYVVCLDADLSYAPYHVEKLLEPLMAGTADITLASAYHPDGGKVSNVPFSRAILSRWGNKVLKAGVYGKFHTLTCVVRGYNRRALNQLELINDGKDLHLEIVQKAVLFGLRIEEVPAHLNWRDRKRGRSKPGILARIPFLSMSGTIASHLVYNYVLRPGSLLMMPMFALVSAVLVGISLLLGTWVIKLATGPQSFGLQKIYVSLRETLLQGTLTLLIVGVAGILSLVFIAFYFASQQNKKNFEELYILLSRMNSRMKDLEKRLDH